MKFQRVLIGYSELQRLGVEKPEGKDEGKDFRLRTCVNLTLGSHYLFSLYL